mmetsp:Transcript_44760/g.85586  ORF Transcript_44760/g.85586 Transcript_44760/m.85586 type:complete len:399 (+) Transcript_44760:2818-4014(+)
MVRVVYAHHANAQQPVDGLQHRREPDVLGGQVHLGGLAEEVVSGRGQAREAHEAAGLVLVLGCLYRLLGVAGQAQALRHARRQGHRRLPEGHHARGGQALVHQTLDRRHNLLHHRRGLHVHGDESLDDACGDELRGPRPRVVYDDAEHAQLLRLLEDELLARVPGGDEDEHAVAQHGEAVRLARGRGGQQQLLVLLREHHGQLALEHWYRLTLGDDGRHHHLLVLLDQRHRLRGRGRVAHDLPEPRGQAVVGARHLVPWGYQRLGVHNPGERAHLRQPVPVAHHARALRVEVEGGTGGEVAARQRRRVGQADGRQQRLVHQVHAPHRQVVVAHLPSAHAAVDLDEARPAGGVLGLHVEHPHLEAERAQRAHRQLLQLLLLQAGHEGGRIVTRLVEPRL